MHNALSNLINLYLILHHMASSHQGGPNPPTYYLLKMWSTIQFHTGGDDFGKELSQV